MAIGECSCLLLCCSRIRGLDKIIYFCVHKNHGSWFMYRILLDILSVTCLMVATRRFHLLTSCLFTLYYIYRVEQIELFSNSLVRILMISPLLFDHRYFFPLPLNWYKQQFHWIFFSLFGVWLIFLFEHQILSWLSHSPTEIESYIRPGCIILTICLRLENSAWNEVFLFFLFD
jgi:hypothetical protein